MSEMLSEDTEIFKDIVSELEGSLASELMDELNIYAESLKCELAVMHGELRVTGGNVLEPATKILANVFPGGAISDWVADDEDGYVYGWSDEVAVSVVESNNEKWLAHVKSHLDKSYASIALRLFGYFSNSDEGPFQKAIVVDSTTDDALQIMSQENVIVFNYDGTQLR